MSQTVRIVKYFYAEIGDTPGEGRRLLEHLSEKGINLVAMTAFPIGKGRSQIDFFPASSVQLQKAAKDAGLNLIGPKKAFLIQGDDRIGALHEHLLNLANAGVNIYAANGVCDGSGRFGYVLWVSPEDFDKAANALGV